MSVVLVCATIRSSFCRRSGGGCFRVHNPSPVPTTTSRIHCGINGNRINRFQVPLPGLVKNTNTSLSFSTWRVAIVGSGPSGCYTAKYLNASLLNDNQNIHNKHDADDNCNNKEKNAVHIDILERLPTPYGLVRNGVAPDHPEVKNVQNDFDTLLGGMRKREPATILSPPNENDDSSGNNIHFFGNVHVGRDVSLLELRQLYDMVVLAYGCESDQSLSIPGATITSTICSNNNGTLNESIQNRLKGILSAREFVAWYNGHIDFEWVGPVIHEALLSNKTNCNKDNKKSDIVVIGHGNVAIDCARILAKLAHELDPTDIASRALQLLGNNESEDDDDQKKTSNDGGDAVHYSRRISIIGRRGHIQGAFTIKELRELTKLPNAKFIVQREELELGTSTEASKQELKESRPRTRIDKLLMKASSSETKQDIRIENTNQVHLRFFMNPIRFESSKDDPTTLARVVCERTKLVGPAGNQTVESTGKEEALEANLALVSIGYKGLPLEGMDSSWFDESRGILKHTNGLVAASIPIEEYEQGQQQCEDTGSFGDKRSSKRTTKGSMLGAVYTAGWLKRGPSGIIGTNIPDAKETVTTMVENAIGSKKEKNDEEDVLGGSSAPLLQSLLEARGVQYIHWDAYCKINEHETNEQQKRHPDQPREKITTKEGLLFAAFSEKT